MSKWLPSVGTDLPTRLMSMPSGTTFCTPTSELSGWASTSVPASTVRSVTSGLEPGSSACQDSGADSAVDDLLDDLDPRQRGRRGLAPAHLEVDVDVEEEQRDRGVPLDLPPAGAGDGAAHLERGEADALVADRGADPEVDLEVERRLEDEQRVEAEVGLHPEPAAGRDQAGLGAGLEGVGGDRDVPDDADGDDPVVELDADPVLRRDAGWQVGEPGVEAADGEDERRVVAEPGAHHQRAGDREQRDVGVAEHGVDRERLLRHVVGAEDVDLEVDQGRGVDAQLVDRRDLHLELAEQHDAGERGRPRAAAEDVVELQDDAEAERDQGGRAPAELERRARP